MHLCALSWVFQTIRSLGIDARASLWNNGERVAEKKEQQRWKVFCFSGAVFLSASECNEQKVPLPPSFYHFAGLFSYMYIIISHLLHNLTLSFIIFSIINSTYLVLFCAFSHIFLLCLFCYHHFAHEHYAHESFHIASSLYFPLYLYIYRKMTKNVDDKCHRHYFFWLWSWCYVLIWI